MPDKTVVCYCGIWCPTSTLRVVSASTHRKHCKVVKELGGVVMPPYAPLHEASWNRPAQANKALYVASQAKAAVQKQSGAGE